MKRSLIVAGTAVVVLAVTAVVVLRVQREREWAHGGDELTVQVEVALATHDTFDATAARLGVPAGEATRFEDADQTVVMQVRWSSSPASSGSFELIALDGRSAPPRPLAADGGWNSDGGTGSNWAGAYQALAERYEWLRGTAEANYTDNNGVNHFPTAAVDAPARGTGTATAWFRQWGGNSIPFTEVERELLVALVYVDDSGEVRWARRIFG